MTVGFSSDEVPSHCLEAVRTSARALLSDPEITKDVNINDAEIQTFLKNLDVGLYERLSKTEAAAMPLRFDSVEQELNFLGLFFLLNIGSGWRKELHEAVDRGAFDTIRFGLLSLHISGERLSAGFLRDIRGPDVASYFDLPYIREVAHPTLVGVSIDSGYSGMGAFLLDITKPVGGEPQAAEEVVNNLVKMFPGFRDMGRVRDRDVFIFKKAQLLVAEMRRRFKGVDSKRFDFSESEAFTIGADNVIPRVLVHLNILSLSPKLAGLIEDQVDLGSVKDAQEEGLDWILRIAAVEAGERIVVAAKAAKEEGTLAVNIKISELETYLWMLGKEKEFRPLKRQVNKKTSFY
ncbi:hypothetical protein BC829DRAFT_485739 [Chytridium lagenaria]|nr:hypothetical protein BC829DRAFT_485739 [Chytridium lagenaria]